MKKIIVIIVVLIGIMSCKKDIIPSEPPYIEQWWDKYYGTYTVFDTANDVTYQMEIKQIERYFDGNIFSDSVLISNINNRFSVTQVYKQNGPHVGFIGFGIHDPLMDINGYKWTFNSKLIKKENNDTLELSYSVANAQYYIEDGIPFFQVVFAKDLAVKNE